MTPEPAASRNEHAIIAAVALSTILAPLNSTMIAVALPRIMRDFDVGVARAGWLVTSYLIVLAALQPVTGKLGDRLGRRPLVLGGLVAFGLSSIGAALAPSLVVLICFRVLQAISGAVVLPNGVALVREVAAEGRRAARFGLVGGAVGLAAAVGPTLGGLLIAAGGWSAIFWVNMPIVVVALGLAWRSLPAGSPRREHAFDWLGSALFCAVLAGAAALLVEGRGGVGAGTLVASSAGLVLAAICLLAHELRHPDPVFHPRLFRIPSFAAATSGVALSNLSMYTLLLAIPILLANRFHWTSVEIGLGLATLSMPMAAFSPVGGRLADRLGRRAPSLVGHALAGAALLALALHGGGEPSVLLPCIAVAGVGYGLAVAPLQTSAVEAVPPSAAGLASGLFSTSRYVGSIVGSSLLAVLLTSTGVGVSGFRSVAILVAAAAFLAVAASAGLVGKRRLPAAQPSEVPVSV